MRTDLGATHSSSAETPGVTSDATRSRPGGAVVRARTAFAHAWPALVGYLATRVLGVAVLAWWAASRGESVWDRLFSYDSYWYATVAQRGYDDAIPAWTPALLGHSDLAFFPLYPMLVRFAHAVTGLDVQVVAIGIAWTSALAAAWGIFAVADHLYGRRVGIFSAILWGVIPNSIIMQMAYSESTFAALAAWSLYAAVRRRWVWASALSVLAGMSRPTGVAVAAGVCLAATTEIVRALRTRATTGDGSAVSWRPWFAVVVAPLGWLGYIGWVAVRLGRWDGYLHVQKNWDSAVSWRMPVLAWIWSLLSSPVELKYVVAAVVLLSSIGLFFVCLLQRQPIELLGYSGVLLLIALTDNSHFWCEARFVLPAFPLVFPVARALAGIRRRSTAILVVGTATVVTAVLGANYLVLGPHYP